MDDDLGGEEEISVSIDNSEPLNEASQEDSLTVDLGDLDLDDDFDNEDEILGLD